MNHIIFTAENGRSVDFRLSDGLVVAHIDNLTNHSVRLSMSQAWQQVGQSVGGLSYAGRSLAIRGYVKTDKARELLLSTLLPGEKGTLFFEDKYAIDCYVQDSPTIAQERFGSFSFRLFAPFPWWRGINEKSVSLGVVKALFSFPINYANAHRFGMTEATGYINLQNNGTQPSSFILEIKGSSPVVNPSIINVSTLKKVAFDIEIPTGYTLRMSNVMGNLSLVLIDSSGDEEDVFYALTYDSDLFMLDVGDNLLNPTAEEGAEGMQTYIRYNEVFSGVSNDMQFV